MVCEVGKRGNEMELKQALWRRSAEISGRWKLQILNHLPSAVSGAVNEAPAWRPAFQIAIVTRLQELFADSRFVGALNMRERHCR
jgi:hypothetical protein